MTKSPKEAIRQSYVPATTRSAIAQFSTALHFELGGRNIELPSYELPGEIEWRADLLRWALREALRELALVSPREYSLRFTSIARQWMEDLGLCLIEVQAVFREAKVITLASESQIRAIRGNYEALEVKAIGELEQLATRYEKMLERCHRQLT